MIRKAFTLVELLVVIAIIGVLVGMAAPAVQSMRESSRRAKCQSRLIPIGMAIQSYHDRWMQFPIGTISQSDVIESVASGNHHNWLGRLMESMDQPVIARRIDRSVSVYDDVNSDVLQLNYPGVHCPSSSGDPANASSYVGLHHPTEKPIDETGRGVFILNVAITRDDVADGLSNTAFVSEKISGFDDLGWLSGTRATLRNAGDGIVDSIDPWANHPPTAVGSIGSRHPAGTHLLFGSGDIRFQSSQTDARVLHQIIDRRDGQLPRSFQTMQQQRLESIR